MSNQICVIIPPELREKARIHRINISEVSRNALADEVKKFEKAGEHAAKQNAPTVSTPLNTISDSERDA